MSWPNPSLNWTPVPRRPLPSPQPIVACSRFIDAATGELKATPRSVLRMDLSKQELSDAWTRYAQYLLENPIKRDDLTGLILGRWHVLGRGKNRPRNRTWGGVEKKIGIGGTAYYSCLCECGTIRDVQATPLRTGRTASCGCITRQLRRAEYGESAFRQLLHSYKKSAESRGYLWGISRAEAVALFSAQCHYCDLPPSSVYIPTRGNGCFTYNGIDRMDNKLGYVAGNVVSSCPTCNRAKSGQRYEVFMSWMQGVKKRAIANESIKTER